MIPLIAQFDALLHKDERQWNLAEAALLIAEVMQPDLNVGQYLEKIADLAWAVEARLPADADDVDKIIELNTYLFGELGFAGNQLDYYDPRNSYLNEVIDRRTGIPITLSILYIELGRRIGLNLEGVGFPGHFLVLCRIGAGEIYLDPFAGGASLTREALRSYLERLSGRRQLNTTQITGATLPASRRDIAERMLRNLKAIHLKAEQWPEALRVLEMLIRLRPDLHAEVRDRGFVYEQLECPRAAAGDYAHYLQQAPGAPDSREVARRLERLQPLVARLI